MTIPALPGATQVRWTGATCGPYTVRTRWAFGLSPAESGTHTHHSDHTQGLRAMVDFISSLFG